MNEQTPRTAHLAMALRVIAAIIAAVPVAHGFAGYYTSDLGWMIVMLAIACALFFIANQIG